jgi:hypothetical protein
MALAFFYYWTPIFYPDVNKISIELLKALETLASTVTTLPRGIVSARYLLMR